MKVVRYFLFASLALAVISCKDKNDDAEPEAFKKEEILQNLADNYIIPGYASFQLKINALHSSWNTFLISQSQSDLEIVKSDWAAANLDFQKIKLFEVGPAMTIGFHSALGTFPADTVQIESNVTNGGYNLATAANIDAIGFDALDFLFYGNDAFNKLTTSAARRQYVTDVIAKMKSETDQVVNAWPAYRAEFIAGTGTSTTSPFAILVNAFCKDYELAKTAKVGVPIGTTTLGIQMPMYLEARRSGLGKQLLEANVKAVHAIFLGNSLSGSSGTGFDDYLVALERSSLASTIDSRFTYIGAQPGSWTGTMEQLMASSPQTLTDYYTYMQGTVVYIKTDMSSAFGVLITYQDNDGD